MKKIKLGSVKDGGLFKRSQDRRAVWMKKIKRKFPYVIFTSTKSELSFSAPGYTVVFVKE